MPLSASNPTPTLDEMMKELNALDRTVQARIEQDTGFRKANASFNTQSETTQLLLAVCDKLVMDKGAMDKASFEEHTAELAYMCKHFGTAINTGLSERYHRDKLMQLQPWSSASSNGRQSKRRPKFFFCCNSEFPPQQSWWIDASQRLSPEYQVLRAGKTISALASDLVPGDILFLGAGQRAAADGRILVFTEGAAIDVSHLTMELSDIRRCSSEATAAAITASSNMVLKDSYVVSGALFCMVVRAPSSSLIPGPHGADVAEEQSCVQDVTVPTGMTAGQCRSLFKTLCTKSRLVCRSFKSMVTLARVQMLVILLTQDLLDAGTVPKLVQTAKRLSKGLVLVDCGCSKGAVSALTQEHGLEHLDVFPLEGAAEKGADGPPSPVAGLVSPTATELTSRPPQSISTGERAKVALFSEALLNHRVPGGVITNLSQAGLTALCAILAEAGAAPLYVMGPFNYPACFKQIVLASSRTRTKERVGTEMSLAMGPKTSMVASEPSIVPAQHRTSSQSTTPLSTAKAGEAITSNNGVSFSRMQSSTSQGTNNGARLSSGELDLSKLNPGKCVEMVVSLNSIGLVSEHADCVLLKSDLGCLAQALETVSKGIPASLLQATSPPAGAAEKRPESPGKMSTSSWPGA